MNYSSWDMEHNKLKLVILGLFCPFTPLKTPKIKILKNKTICWRYHDFTQVYQRSQSHDVWFLRYGVRHTKCFIILGHFLPFYHPPPTNDPENQNFERKKQKWKKWLKILSFYTYMCTRNEDHMIRGSWNIRSDRQKILTFLTLSAPWQPRKSKFLNWKKHLKILSFYTFAP